MLSLVSIKVISCPVKVESSLSLSPGGRGGISGFGSGDMVLRYVLG